MNLFLDEERKPTKYLKCTHHLSQGPSVVLELYFLANIKNQVFNFFPFLVFLSIEQNKIKVSLALVPLSSTESVTGRDFLS